MNDTMNVPAVIQAALKAQNIDISKCNLMLPTETYGAVIGMFNKVTMESIKVNPNPDAKEVYEPNGKGKGKAFAKVPLQKIAIAMSMKWDPVTTGTVEDTKTKCRAKATAAIKKPNGDPIIITDEKTIDVDALVERDTINLEEKAEKGNPDEIERWQKTDSGKSYPIFKRWKDETEKSRWLARAVRKARNHYELVKNELANTGAHERVIRAFIAMKSTYTDEELAMPFVYPCISLDPEKLLATPELQQAAIRNMDESIHSVFGPSPGAGEMRNVTPERKALTADAGGKEPEAGGNGQQSSSEAAEQAAGAASQADLFEPEDEKPPEKTPVEKAREMLESFREKLMSSKKATTLLNETLAKKSATLEELNSVIDRFTAYLQKHGRGAV